MLADCMEMHFIYLYIFYYTFIYRYLCGCIFLIFCTQSCCTPSDSSIIFIVLHPCISYILIDRPEWLTIVWQLNNLGNQIERQTNAYVWSENVLFKNLNTDLKWFFRNAWQISIMLHILIWCSSIFLSVAFSLSSLCIYLSIRSAK